MSTNTVSIDFRLMGFRCEMSIDIDNQGSGIKALWTPDVPKAQDFETKQAREKFIRKYAQARNDFMAEVARQTGKTILLIE